jgi:hypothetical protein
MRMLTASLFAVLFAATAAHAHAGRAPTRQFDLANDTFDSVTAIAVAPAGTGTFQEIAIGDALRGGHTSITLDMPEGGCVRDLRVAFRDGRKLLYPGIDLCRTRGLRLRTGDERR